MTAQPTPAPASTPAPNPLKWLYPFPGIDNKEITNPQRFYQAFSAMDDGFFPLGVNGFPHGGVHFNDKARGLQTAPGVRCIADGHIVAYKLDRANPQMQFKDGKWVMYSTGFVLVRHTLTLPPAPNSTGPQPADESHDIYSLYMHMADWCLYLADAKLVRPYWWYGVDVYRVGNREHQNASSDSNGGGSGAAGTFVWTEPKAGRKAGRYTAGGQVGFLPEGTEVTVGETRGNWVHIKEIKEGEMVSPVNGGYFGAEDKNVPWVAPDGADFHNPPSLTPEGDWGWLYKPNNLEPKKEPTSVDVVVPVNPPLFVQAGTLLGQLGEYQDYERGSPLPPVSRRRLMHLEVFADDGFSAFLDRSRARAAQLPASEKTLLVMKVGAKLVPEAAKADRKLGHYPLHEAKPTPDSPATGLWVKVQPKFVNSSALLESDGPPVWIERENLATATANTPAWWDFPLSLQIAANPANGFTIVFSRAQLEGLSAEHRAIDDTGTHWWRVQFGKGDGKQALGWVCEKSHPATEWQSPWAWPGFEKVDATGINPADAFKRNLVLTGVTSRKEQAAFGPSITAVNSSQLLSKLEQTIAKMAPPHGRAGKDSSNNKPNSAGIVTASAMQAAMYEPWLAQALSHVILRYESEWSNDMARWNAITPLMRNAKENWQVELQRIQKLQWWNDVKGKVDGFPDSAIVHHIHPIGLIANFACGCSGINIDAFLHRYEAEHASFETGAAPLDVISKENLRILIQGILDYYKKCKNGEYSIPRIAYILGTARHETKKFNHDKRIFVYFEPTTESGSLAYFNKYDPILADTEAHRQRAIDNGNTRQGDGYKYRGRGYVQVTWKKNYEAIGQKMGVDLVSNPDRSLEPEIAAWATVYGMETGLFTGKKLSTFINEEHHDYFNARKIINGTDEAEKIANYAAKFKLILEAEKC